MKRTLKYALASALAAMIVVPAAMADQFPDVPENHWAYKELKEMKEAGLLVGYPDGLFRGGRPASRYELAVAVYATYNNLKKQLDDHKRQMDDIMSQLSKFATKEELAALKDQLDKLSAEVDRIKREDIARLDKITSFLEDELKKLGADVKAMHGDIQKLSGRVDEIEKRLLPFNVTGELNAVMLAGYSSDTHFGIDVTGRPLGVGRDDFGGARVGATRDLTMLHEGALTIASNDQWNAENKVKFHATAAFGNMIGGSGQRSFNNDGDGFGNQSSNFAGIPYLEESQSTLYFQDFAVEFDTSILGLGFNANLGRVGYDAGSYVFKRPDTTPYFANERWDDGLWRFDGGILGFHFGKAKLDVFGGRMNTMTATNGTNVQPIFAGQAGNPYTPGDPRPIGFNSGGLLPVDQMLGAHLSLPLTSSGALNLAYLWLDSNTIATPGGFNRADRVNVMEGDVHFNFGGAVVNGGYSKSDVAFNNHNSIDNHDAAWWANIGWDRARWGASVGYRNIDPQFGAPGDWGRIGIWWNPTDIRGFMANGHYDLNEKLRLAASGEWYTGTNTTINGVKGLSTDDKINHYMAGLEYKMASNYNLALGWEHVDWNLKSRGLFVGGKPQETWWNVGFGFDLSQKAKLSFLWQISDYDGKGVAGFQPFGGGDFRARGGLITTQLTVKF